MKGCLAELAAELQRFRRDTRGAVAAIMAVVMVTLVGAAALGVETGLWFSEKRHYQTAADAAAISGAFQLAAQVPNIACSGGAGTTNMIPIDAMAQSMADANGFIQGKDTLTVDTPPVDGPYAGNPCAVEATIAAPKKALLAAVDIPGVTIGVKAVALVNPSFGGGACDVALNPNPTAPSGNGNVAGINIAGTATVSQPGCLMVSNSTNACSFSTNGTPTVNISDIYTAGGDCLGSNTTFSNTNGDPPVTGGDQVQDPFANTFPNNPDMPTGSSCPGGSAIKNPTNTTILPGTYSQINLTTGGPYYFAPGTYYICGSGGGMAGSFTASVPIYTGSAAAPGSAGATFIVQGTIDVTGTGTLAAPLPSSGEPYPGILFYQPGDGTDQTKDTINGGSNLILTGAIYLPGGNLTFNGSNATSSTACVELVAYTIQFTGTSSLSNGGCSAAGVQKIYVTNVSLVQ